MAPVQAGAFFVRPAPGRWRVVRRFPSIRGMKKPTRAPRKRQPAAVADDTTSPPVAAHEYSVDELARAAGTTVRNVRAYQDRGLIAPPVRRGRTAFYSDTHLARLRIIGELLARGYTLANIAELLVAWEHGRDLTHVIGVETALASPWNDETPVTLPYDQVFSIPGLDVTPEQLRTLVGLGHITIAGDKVTVTSPRLLRASTELLRAGIPPHLLLRQASAMRVDIERIADGIARMMAEGLLDPFGKGRLPPASELPRLIEAVHRLRPLAEEVVSSELARAMERVAARYLSDRLLAALKPGLAPDNP